MLGRYIRLTVLLLVTFISSMSVAQDWIYTTTKGR